MSYTWIHGIYCPPAPYCLPLRIENNFKKSKRAPSEPKTSPILIRTESEYLYFAVFYSALAVLILKVSLPSYTSSVKSSSFRDPYIPVPELWRKAISFLPILSIALVSTSMLLILLSRILFFLASVHLIPAGFSPAKLITASTSLRTCDRCVVYLSN